MRLLDMTPEVSSEPLDRMMKNCEAVYVLSAAIDLDIFDVLNQPMSADQLSMVVGTDASLTEKFLNTLVALELLSKHDGTYTNTKLASTFLVKDSPFYQGNLLRLSMRSSSNLSMLTHVLRGEVRDEEEKRLERAFDSSFVLAMAEGAMRGSLHRTVKEVSKLVEFQRARRLLDLGGGHGLYAIAFSQINPKLEAVVFDLPHVVKVAEEFIARYGMKERIMTVGGNFLEDDIGDGYDMVFASDVFYRERDIIIGILRKIRDALRENGSVVLKHWILDDERTAPLVSVFFDLKLSLHVNERHVYTEGEFVEMLQEAGFSSIRTLDISTPSSPSMIIMGRKES
ncbi:MAG: methyltransferase [Methermicoccaceae archaeon]